MVKEQPISATSIPEFAQETINNDLTLRHSVAELEAMVSTAHQKSNANVKLTHSGSVDLARYMDHESGDPYQQIMALYWSVSAVTVAGVIDQVRTTLTGSSSRR